MRLLSTFCSYFLTSSNHAPSTGTPFRRHMGTTPYNYLVNFRITQAKELLVLTDHSVSGIAQEVGFGDASNFSTRFAKATGQSPLQYRKSALKPLETAG